MILFDALQPARDDAASWTPAPFSTLPDAHVFNVVPRRVRECANLANSGDRKDALRLAVGVAQAVIDEQRTGDAQTSCYWNSDGRLLAPSGRDSRILWLQRSLRRRAGATHPRW